MSSTQDDSLTKGEGSKSAATIICDSISPTGHRLTTIEVTMHRFVLAEFNTHRVFSRNSASSRAIPVRKMLERVIENPALPLSWPAEQKGMQGGAELEGEELAAAQETWLEARDQAVEMVKLLQARGLHKSVTNRLLEPFMWHTAIVSATEWDNFFALRSNSMAQAEIHATSEAMELAYQSSQPAEIPLGGWHLPYVGPEDMELDIGVQVKISAARCARVSYLTHDGIRDVGKDLELYTRLISASPSHASPLEHVATPCSAERLGVSSKHHHLGNFRGWDQLRHLEGM